MAANTPLLVSGGRYIIESSCPLTDCTERDLHNDAELAAEHLIRHIGDSHTAPDLAAFLVRHFPTSIVRQRLHPEG